MRSFPGFQCYSQAPCASCRHPRTSSAPTQQGSGTSPGPAQLYSGSGSRCSHPWLQCTLMFPVPQQILASNGHSQCDRWVQEDLLLLFLSHAGWRVSVNSSTLGAHLPGSLLTPVLLTALGRDYAAQGTVCPSSIPYAFRSMKRT